MKRTVITAIRHRETLVQIRPCVNPDFKSGRFRWTGLNLLRFSCVWSFDLPDLRVSFDIATLIQFLLCVETVLFWFAFLMKLCCFGSSLVQNTSLDFASFLSGLLRCTLVFRDWLWLFQVHTFGNQTVSESVRLQFRSHGSWPWHVTSESSFPTPRSRDHRNRWLGLSQVPHFSHGWG